MVNPDGERHRGSSATSARILDIAERLVQVRGFNAFSYADVAAELKVTKAALHYHFPGKAELGEALIARYSARIAAALDAIDATVTSPLARLDAYIDIYANIVRQHRMCLCGMLAAEYQTLPETMQSEVVGFFDHNEAWLERVLEQGRSEGSLRFDGPARDLGQMIINILQGAMLVARPYGDVERFRAAAARTLSRLRADVPPES